MIRYTHKPIEAAEFTESSYLFWNSLFGDESMRDIKQNKYGSLKVSFSWLNFVPLKLFSVSGERKNISAQGREPVTN